MDHIGLYVGIWDEKQGKTDSQMESGLGGESGRSIWNAPRDADGIRIRGYIRMNMNANANAVH